MREKETGKISGKSVEEEIIVKLKPFMGMRPGVYLAVIYSFILLVILFFLLLYPGLKEPGAMLIVKTEPSGAAIRVNDVYMGVSDSKIFVPKGMHAIEAVMPGFESQSSAHEIPGRVLGSLFFPLIYRTEISLKTSNPAASFALYAADFASWTFAGEPTASWQIPLSLSEGAYRLGHYLQEAEQQEILKAASRFTVTRAALRDLIRAKILLDNSGGAPSAPALIGSISDIMVFLSENPGSAQWLSGLLPNEIAAVIEASDWYKNSSAASSAARPINPGSRRIEVAGLTFTEITGSFMISETPVPISLFETFLNENPEWQSRKTDYFQQEIAVNPLETYKRDAVTGVTWYAAEAFCKWLTGRLPSSMAGMEVKLPTEAQWLAAAQSISNMRTPGWEWCADPFSPLSFIAASDEAIKAVGSPERILLGRPSLPSSETKASFPPDLSSPVITFRPVLAEIE